jgi:hypothetical protein
MKELNTGEDVDVHLKDHEKILKKIEEIKEFEKKISKFDLSDIKPKEELIEVDNQLEEFFETQPKDAEKPEENNHLFRGSGKKQHVERALHPTVFHLRIKNEKLENIDIKKPIVQEKKKKSFRATQNKEEKGEDKSEKSSKLSFIKGGIGRIRKAIPSRQKKSENE